MGLLGVVMALNLKLAIMACELNDVEHELDNLVEVNEIQLMELEELGA